MHPRLVTSSDAKTERSLSASFPPDTRVYPVADFSDGLRFLVQVFEPSRIYSAVVNGDGEVITDFGDTSASSVVGFEATSVSSDGRYVVGYHMVDDGHAISSSRLYLSDATNTWRVPIESAPDGTSVRLSPVGMKVAYIDAFEGVAHVGTLEITRR
jgi:hypothetical protein